MGSRLRLLALVLLGLPTIARAAEPTPGSACTTANAVIIEPGAATSGIGYNMICTGGKWVNRETVSPTGTLSVNGGVQPGYDVRTCNAAAGGAISFNSATNLITYCNGSAWSPFSSFTCPAGYTAWAGNCYKVTTTTNDWDTGRSACQADGGDAATITSTAEWTFLKTFLATDAMVGYKNNSTATDFTWLATSAWTTVWCSSEPSTSYGAGQGIGLYNRQQQCLSNFARFYSNRAILCKKPATPVVPCTAGAAVGSGICAGSVNGHSMVMAPKGCPAGATSAASCNGSTDAQAVPAHNNLSTTTLQYPVDGVTATNILVSQSAGGAQACANSTLDGKSWHLPARAEMEAMYDNLATTGLGSTFASGGCYQTSNEDTNGYTGVTMNGSGAGTTCGGNNDFGTTYFRCVYWQ